MTPIHVSGYFEKARNIAERTHNILKAAKVSCEGDVDEGLLAEDPEKRLWEKYIAAAPGIEGLINSKNYNKATEMYAEAFYEVLHTFFDKVLVNVDDERLKINRLTIIRKVNTLYGLRVADLSKIAVNSRLGTNSQDLKYNDLENK